MRARYGIRLIVVVALLGGSIPALMSRGYAHNAEAEAVLRNTDGVKVGKVKFEQQGGTVRVKIDADFPAALAPGFHGFHIHEGITCDRTTGFSSAGGHFNPAGKTHKDHAGDMPVILVNEDGTAVASFRTDRVDVSHSNSAKYIVDRTVIVHMAADNYANIPTSYSAAGPNEATLKTGDAGGRYACGEIKAEDDDD